MKRFKITTIQGVFMLFAIASLMALLTGSSFFYYILITLITTTVLMYFIVLNNGKKIFQFLKLSAHEIEVGESINLEVTSSNNSLFPVAYAKINCMVYNDNHDITLPSENIFFNPYQIINQKEDFVIKNRGIYNNSVVVTELADPLRIFKRQIKYERPLELVVYPRVHQLTYFYLPSTGYLGTNRVMKSGHEDYSSLKKVRPYIHGDSIKKVHWKLSSKRGEMFVKEYESTSSTKVNVFLNAYHLHYEDDVDRINEDCAVEVTASIIKYALSQNAETSLVYQSDHEVQIESRDLSTFPQVLKQLVNFVTKGELSYSELLNQETKRLEQGSFVVLITPEVDQGLINVILGLRRRSFIISLIVTNQKSLFTDTKELLMASGVNLYNIQPGVNIKQELEAFK